MRKSNEHIGNYQHSECFFYRKSFVVAQVYGFCEMTEVSNTTHFGSVSDSLGQLAAASECMASS